MLIGIQCHFAIYYVESKFHKKSVCLSFYFFNFPGFIIISFVAFYVFLHLQIFHFNFIS